MSFSCGSVLKTEMRHFCHHKATESLSTTLVSTVHSEQSLLESWVSVEWGDMGIVQENTKLKDQPWSWWIAKQAWRINVCYFSCLMPTFYIFKINVKFSFGFAHVLDVLKDKNICQWLLLQIHYKICKSQWLRTWLNECQLLCPL